MNLRHFILDCDDVLLRWCDGFREFLSDKHGIKTHGHAPQSWDLNDWTGLDDVVPYINEFNVSSEFARLKPYDGVISAVRHLRQLGHRVTVLSSCVVPNGPTADLRISGLNKLFGADAFDDIILLPMGASKNAVLSTLEYGVWVDDNPNHAMAGFAVGHQAWCVRRPHNRYAEGTPEYEGLQWADSVAEVIFRYCPSATNDVDIEPESV